MISVEEDQARCYKPEGIYSALEGTSLYRTPGERKEPLERDQRVASFLCNEINGLYGDAHYHLGKRTFLFEGTNPGLVIDFEKANPRLNTGEAA
jgi:hypothetical protein